MNCIKKVSSKYRYWKKIYNQPTNQPTKNPLNPQNLNPQTLSHSHLKIEQQNW